VWTAGPAPIDLGATWPTPIIRAVVGAFSKPGARVALLPWPHSHASPGAGLRRADDARVPERRAEGVSPAADNDTAVADALVAVDGLGRTGRVLRIATDADTTGPVSRPFWADLVGTREQSRSDTDATALDSPRIFSADTDLIITGLSPEHSGDQSSDLVALAAARLLRVGGILAVLTHCDWSQSELIDPTGAMVAAAQNADLLYLQHIVALHAPVHGGRIATESLVDTSDPTGETQALAAHRAAVRALPAPHQRIHSDVLVFAQPHDHEPLAVSPAEQARTSGVIG
jgi:hypothetical protein